MLSAELDTVLRRRPDLQVATVADGAPDNWRYLDALACEATAVVDFYHAAEQLKSALDAAMARTMREGAPSSTSCVTSCSKTPMEWRR